MVDNNNQLSPDKGNIYMFAGKGGVGKTTCAASTALHYAYLGGQTIAISTDATPSLAHIFEVSGNEKPTMVQESLYISELGLKEVEQMWDKKFGREVYGVFSSFVSTFASESRKSLLFRICICTKSSMVYLLLIIL